MDGEGRKDKIRPLRVEILKARILEWITLPFSKGIFPSPGLNPGFLHCRQILYCLSHRETHEELG